MSEEQDYNDIAEERDRLVEKCASLKMVIREKDEIIKGKFERISDLEWSNRHHKELSELLMKKFDSAKKLILKGDMQGLQDLLWAPLIDLKDDKGGGDEDPGEAEDKPKRKKRKKQA